MRRICRSDESTEKIFGFLVVKPIGSYIENIDVEF
nr:MAG TPA: hypothetical protein [Caudoviricetes sp.]